MGNGDVVKGFHHGSGGRRGGLVVPLSPCNLSADSNRPRQRRKRSSSSRVRGRSTSRGGVDVEPIDRGTESESSTPSTDHSSFGGQPYTPSLPDDSSDRDADLDPLRKDSDWLCLKDAVGTVHQLETPESSVHRVPMPWTNNSLVTPNSDSLASSAVKVSGSGSGNEEGYSIF
jgi:hypothetical protein